MSLYRIPIISDNTISTYSVNPNTAGLGNAGASQIVDVWAWYKEDKDKKYLARILAKADITALSDAINSRKAKNPATDPSVSCNLKFFNINHGDPNAYDFNLNIHCLTTAWSEGNKTRIDSFSQEGISNWLSASTTAAWTTSGGDYSSDSTSATQYFGSGYEDLNVDIRNMVNYWLTGASNHGFVIKMNDAAEDLTGSNTATLTQYYRKSFHGRLTNYPNFAPYIELAWDDVIRDDRSIFKLGSSGNLYFYNYFNGALTDIDSSTAYFPGSVTIYGSKNASTWTSLFTVSNPAWVDTGIYKVTFTLPATASIYSSFRDAWVITSAAAAITPSATNQFYASSPVGSVSYNYANYDLMLKVIDFPQVIYKPAKITKKLFVKENNAVLEPLVQSEKNSISSIASVSLTSVILSDAYYRVLVDGINRVDIDWTQLSYDGMNNFFTIDTNNFARQVKYKLEFKINYRNQTFIFDDDPSYSFEVR